MTRYMIIVNPASGRGNGEKVYPLIEARLQALGLEFAMQRTQSVGHATQLAEEAAAAGWDVVVAAGGDGTANEVLNGLAHALQKGSGNAALGLIPVGRGNDFGFGIGMPHDLEVACQALADGRRRWIDVGFVQGGDYPQGRFFGNGVGIGFDAVVGFESLKLKRLSGFPSYIVAAVKTIALYFNAPLVQIELDDQTLNQKALMVSVMNGRRMGGGFMMAPESSIDDALFDLCIAGQVSRLKILLLIPRFMQGSQANHPAVRMARSKQAIITSWDGGLPAHADGETLCTTGQRLEMKVLPKMLEVIVPPQG
jgi:diacylglycerol kinase (ATP)